MSSGKPLAYYNEIDPFAAQWLRELIARGLIAQGDVDERSIRDVQPEDIRGYTQCHWFAGIGGWSHALRLAGWPDDRPVWTGSCPCQSFSAAGKQLGFSDERHLWPEWFRLIHECQPSVIISEQVAAAIRMGWLDLVQTDLEGKGYAVGKAVLGACSVGAPHIRQRLYFVAHAEHAERWAEHQEHSDPYRGHGFGRSGNAGIMGNAFQSGLEGHSWHGDHGNEPGRKREDAARPVAETGEPGGMADSERDGLHRTGRDEAEPSRNGENSGLSLGSGEGLCGTNRTSPLNGPWRDADWLLCRDGKWRPVESGTFPLVTGTTARVGRLRGYGNAIVPQVAAEFIMAYLECEPDTSLISAADAAPETQSRPSEILADTAAG